MATGVSMIVYSGVESTESLSHRNLPLSGDKTSRLPRDAERCLRNRFVDVGGRRNQQHGQRRVAHALLGDAAEHETAEPAAAVRAEYEQIGIESAPSRISDDTSLSDVASPSFVSPFTPAACMSAVKSFASALPCATS